MENPYSAPDAALDDPALLNETYDPSLFAWSGRIGRLRYLAYTWTAAFISMFSVGIVSAILIPIVSRNGSTSAIIVVGLLTYIPVIAISLIMAKRRLNDLNHTGWFALLFLIPFVNLALMLYLMFAPGTPSTNNFGPRPVKNSWLVIAGIVAPFLMVGILAAIAIPQYQAYVERAKAKEAIEQVKPAND